MDQLDLSPAGLEHMAAEAEKVAAHCRKTGHEPSWFVDWPGTLALVCRFALTQAAELEALRNPQPPRTAPCPRCRGEHVCVGCEPGLCEFPCPGCNCTGRVKETS